MFTWPTLPPLDAAETGVWVAAVLTLAVLSAAFAENHLSRAALAVLVGATVGYVAAMTGRAVLWPRVMLIWRDPFGQWPLLLWFCLGLLLLTRGLPSVSWLSAIPQLIAAVAEPRQVRPGAWLAAINVLLVAVGTGGVLFRFTYTGLGGKGLLARLWSGIARSWGRVGYVFLLVAFGALFATATISLLALLASRLQFLLTDWLHLVGG
jgi:hypothetical protein